MGVVQSPLFTHSCGTVLILLFHLYTLLFSTSSDRTAGAGSSGGRASCRWVCPNRSRFSLHAGAFTLAPFLPNSSILGFPPWSGGASWERRISIFKSSAALFRLTVVASFAPLPAVTWLFLLLAQLYYAAPGIFSYRHNDMERAFPGNSSAPQGPLLSVLSAAQYDAAAQYNLFSSFQPRLGRGLL